VPPRWSWTLLLSALLLLGRAAPARAITPGPLMSDAEALGEAFRFYDGGDLERARAILAALGPRADKLRNRDLVLWLRGQLALALGEPDVARPAFVALAKQAGSRLAAAAPWRLADCDWDDGRRTAAATAYKKLLATPNAERYADLGAVRFRIATAAAGAARTAALREFLREHPAHPLAVEAEQLFIAATGAAPVWTDRERIARAKTMHAAHQWHEAVAELALVAETAPQAVRDAHDAELGKTLFDMRRRYGEAGELLLRVYPRLGAGAPEAMFHGARALSRADRDDEAITWYDKFVAAYPRAPDAAEAQYLSGWLEFNRGRYKEGLPALQATLDRYGGSKFASLARWFLGMSHYLLGDFGAAAKHLGALGEADSSLEGGKGIYWLARTHQQTGASAEAVREFTSIVRRWPFSWYALLARARLAEAGVVVGPFGNVAGTDAPTPSGTAIATTLDPAYATKLPVLARVDELIEAGLGVEAGDLLEPSEKTVLAAGPRAQMFAEVLERYRRAGNFNRPWMIATVYSDRALRGPAEGPARLWWEHAYPRAYQALIEQHQAGGGNPDGYLYSIMRKESGFDPHVLSYADAQGLLQMIPATTIRVAQQLGLTYDPGRLYEPAFNVQTAAWYIGNLLAKFKGQIPLGAGSFNSGPRPVMRWCDKNGARPIDEFVELVTYVQTREYMKKVTENYARYRYLYQGEVYEQPLVVDPAYVVNDLTY
jgi:soluble lytic murein transglycosylase